MTDLSSEKYKSGGRTIDGTFNIESNVDTKYAKELGGIPVTISKFITNKNDYVEIDKTVTSLATDYGNTGKFRFTGLSEGSYKISTPKTNTFKAFEEVTLIDKDGNANDNTTLSDIPVNFNLPLNIDEMNGLKIKVTSAHTGIPLKDATIKIDGKAVNVTNEEGISEVDGVSTGFHEIEVSCNNHKNLKGKFQITEYTNKLQEVVGSDSLDINMIETTQDHKNSIVGSYFPKDNNPKYVALYKYSLATESNNISYYNIEYIKMTKTSYGIDGTPNGSFKFIDLPEKGFYQLYVCDDPNRPDPQKLSATFKDEDYQIYNLSNSDIDISNYKWQPLANIDNKRASRPIYLDETTTVYWSNIDNLSTTVNTKR